MGSPPREGTKGHVSVRKNVDFAHFPWSFDVELMSNCAQKTWSFCVILHFPWSLYLKTWELSEKLQDYCWNQEKAPYNSSFQARSYTEMKFHPP